MLEGWQGVLGVFQKLIASKAHDHEGFFILNSLLEYLPMELYQQYLPTVRALTCLRIRDSLDWQASLRREQCEQHTYRPCWR